MLSLVYLTTRENKDLVTENYYDEELEYQKIIDQSSNTASLSQKPLVFYIDGHLEIVLPKEFENIRTEGSWLLYFAADQSKDLSGKFSCTNGSTKIDIPKSMQGHYQFKLSWKTEKTNYYYEKDISL
jgi:hypothetical protein